MAEHKRNNCLNYTAQKLKFSINHFFSKCDQIRSFLIWSHLLKKPLMSLILLLPSEYVVPKLLPCYLMLVGFFPMPSTHHLSPLKNCLSWCYPSPEMLEWVLLMPPTKSEPFSDLITLTWPLHPTNSLKLTMNASVLRKCTNTMCMALIDRQVQRATYPLTSFRRSFTMNVPNKSTSQYINGGSSLILPFGKSVIYCCRSFPLRQIQQTVVNFFWPSSQ